MSALVRRALMQAARRRASNGTLLFLDPCDNTSGWTALEAGLTAGGTLRNTSGSVTQLEAYRAITPFSTSGANKYRLEYDAVVPTFAAGTVGVSYSVFYAGFAASQKLSATFADWYVIGATRGSPDAGFCQFTNFVWNTVIAPASVVVGRTYHCTIDCPGNGTIIYSVKDTLTEAVSTYTQTVTCTLNCVYLSLIGSAGASIAALDNIALYSY